MQGDNDGPLDAFGRAFGARVDGASPRRFLRFLSLTAFQAEGCGIARRAMSIKSALRVWLSVSYSMIRILVIGSLRSPPPIRAAPDFPLFRGKNKTQRNTLFINGSTVSTGYSATVEVLHRTSKWGEVRRLACPLRRFPFAAPPNCGGGKGTGFIGEPRDPRIQ